MQRIRTRGLREEGDFALVEGYPAYKPEELRQTQGAQVPGAAYYSVLSRHGSKHRFHQRGIDGLTLTLVIFLSPRS